MLLVLFWYSVFSVIAFFIVVFLNNYPLNVERYVMQAG